MSVKEIIVILCAHACFTGIITANQGGNSVRLNGSSLPYAGRVEIKRSTETAWETVCDTSWTIEDARVVCGQLNFKNAEAAISGAAFGQGFGSIWWHNVLCHGNESSLLECGNNNKNDHTNSSNNCDHSGDVGVLCTPNLARDAQQNTTVFLVIISLLVLLCVPSIILLIITCHQIHGQRLSKRHRKRLLNRYSSGAEDGELGTTNSGIEDPSYLTHDHATVLEGRIENNNDHEIQPENNTSHEKIEPCIQLQVQRKNPSESKRYMKLNRGSKTFSYFYTKLMKKKTRESEIEINEDHKYYDIKEKRGRLSTASAHEYMDYASVNDNPGETSSDDPEYLKVRGREGILEENNSFEEYLEILPSQGKAEDKKRDSDEYLAILPSPKNQQKRTNQKEEEEAIGRQHSYESDENITETSGKDVPYYANEKNIGVDCDYEMIKEEGPAPDYLEMLPPEETETMVAHSNPDDTLENEPEYMEPAHALSEHQSPTDGYSKELPEMPSDYTYILPIEFSKTDEYATVIPCAERGNTGQNQCKKEALCRHPSPPPLFPKMKPKECVNLVGPISLKDQPQQGAGENPAGNTNLHSDVSDCKPMTPLRKHRTKPIELTKTGSDNVQVTNDVPASPRQGLNYKETPPHSPDDSKLKPCSPIQDKAWTPSTERKKKAHTLPNENSGADVILSQATTNKQNDIQASREGNMLISPPFDNSNSVSPNTERKLRAESLPDEATQKKKPDVSFLMSLEKALKGRQQEQKDDTKFNESSSGNSNAKTGAPRIPSVTDTLTEGNDQATSKSRPHSFGYEVVEHSQDQSAEEQIYDEMSDFNQNCSLPEFVDGDAAMYENLR